MPKDFAHVLQQLPEEQRRVLERMGALGLVTQFGWSDITGRWTVLYTPAGRRFLKLVRAVTSPDPDFREASLIALEMLASGNAVPGGFGHP